MKKNVGSAKSNIGRGSENKRGAKPKFNAKGKMRSVGVDKRNVKQEERQVREDHERRERERARNVRRDSGRHQGVTPRPREHRPTGIDRFTTIAVSIILVGVGFAFAILWFNRDDEPPTSETVRSSVIATRTPRPSPPPPRPTATPVPRVTAASASNPTPSLIVKPTSTRVLTSAPTRTPVPTQPRNIENSVTYGPTSGTLNSDPDTGKWFDSQTNFKDLLAEVSFTIPKTIVGDYWVGAVIIRATESAADAIGIVSDGTWFHSRHNGTEWEHVAQGYSKAINTKPEEKNRVQVAAVGESGLLSINSELTAELGFGVPTRSGTVIITSDADRDTSPVNFSGFTIRSVNADQQLTTILALTPTPVLRAIPTPSPTSTSNSIKPQTAKLPPAQPTPTPKPTLTGSNTLLHDLLNNHPSTVNAAKVKALIDAGVNANGLDVHGRYPLDVAAEKSHKHEVFVALVDAGATLPRESDALHVLIENHPSTVNAGKVNALIQARADANALDARGRTPLQVAADKSHKQEVFNALVDAGATLPPKSDTLHVLLNNHPSTVNAGKIAALIQAGADANALDAGGRNPLDIAAEKSHKQEVFNALVGAAAILPRQSDALHVLLENHPSTVNAGKVNALIQAGADVNALDARRIHPLDVAAEKSHKHEVFNALVDAGATLPRQSMALHELLKNHPSTVNATKVDALIRAGADINVLDADGRTPL